MIRLWSNFQKKSLFFSDIFTISNILLYLEKKVMSKTQAKKLSLKFAPYLFVAVTILTAISSNNGTWVWVNSGLVA